MPNEWQEIRTLCILAEVLLAPHSISFKAALLPAAFILKGIMPVSLP
jgi:hypothetical protein